METEFRARFDETYVNLQLHRSPSLCIDSQNLRVTSNIKTFPWTNLENSSRPRCQQLVTKWTAFARMYIQRTRGDLLSICENDGPFLDFTREIKETRLIRLNEFISNLHRYPRRSFSRSPRGSRVDIPRMWKLLQHSESCVKTNQGLSLSLSSYLLSRLHGRLGESRRESASCVDARDRRHADRWYQTRTYGLRDAGKLIGILTVVLLRRGGLFCTGWGAQARWSAGAQEWRRVTRGHKRGRTVTLARMKRRV